MEIDFLMNFDLDSTLMIFLDCILFLTLLLYTVSISIQYMLSRAMSVEAKQAKGRIQREMPLRQSFLRRDKWDISVGENPQGRMELKFHQKKIFSCRHYCFILIFVSFNSFIRGKKIFLLYHRRSSPHSGDQNLMWFQKTIVF